MKRTNLSYSIKNPAIINVGSSYVNRRWEVGGGGGEEGWEKVKPCLSSYKGGIDCFIFDIDNEKNIGSGLV